MGCNNSCNPYSHIFVFSYTSISIHTSAYMSFEVNYSLLDRTTHRLAFSLPYIQLIAADIEESLYASSYKDIEVNKPIFVTSLPRAGTTLLLEVLNSFSSTTTHTYRDMPFIMAPILFSRAGKLFQQKSTLKERFHADGIKIGFDSAEAFEEVIWKQFWPKKYHNKQLLLLLFIIFKV